MNEHERSCSEGRWAALSGRQGAARNYGLSRRTVTRKETKESSADAPRAERVVLKAHLAKIFRISDRDGLGGRSDLTATNLGVRPMMACNGNV